MNNKEICEVGASVMSLLLAHWILGGGNFQYKALDWLLEYQAMTGPVVEHDFFKSVIEISRQGEVIKMLAVLLSLCRQILGYYIKSSMTISFHMHSNALFTTIQIILHYMQSELLAEPLSTNINE
jgi:gamma-glutamylcysteine synthetase